MNVLPSVAAAAAARSRRLLALALALSPAAACAPRAGAGPASATPACPAATAAADAAREAKDVAHRYHVEVWGKHDLDAVDALVDPTFVSHASQPGTPPGPAASKGFLKMLFTAFPDLTSEEVLVVGEGDKVALYWTIRATHGGPFLGVAATGKRVEVSGMDILRVKDGKLVEHWGGIGDQFPKLLKQLAADAPAGR